MIVVFALELIFIQFRIEKDTIINGLLYKHDNHKTQRHVEGYFNILMKHQKCQTCKSDVEGFA